MSKTLCILGLVAQGICTSVLAVSMNFGGHFRAETAYYGSLGLGVTGVSGAEKTYLSGRALLDPTLVIDDHFSLYSQWNVLATASAAGSALTTPPATVGLVAGQGGYVFGDQSATGLILNRVWLEWTSDFGVLRLGRMPVAWGYGLLYDGGNQVWDNWQTTYDRFEYRLHLGHVIGGIAYSKPRKSSVIAGTNDQDFYSIYIKYDNPELEVEAGIMYEKQARTSGQQAELLNDTRATTGVDRALQLGLAPGRRTPYPLNNNLVDVYVKKTLRYFTFGGEIAWIGGSAADFDNNANADTLNAFAFMVNAAYERHMLKAFVDFVWASGDSNVNDGSMNGFILMHRNRHPGLIMGRELMGASHGNTVGLGSLFAYSNSQNSFSGAYYLRPGIRFDWSQDWSTGLELIWARKAAVAAGEAADLGFEVDLGVEHTVYQNCFLGANAGILFAGSGLSGSNRNPVAVRAHLGVTF
ncbi:MAG: hypothetical protein H6617_11405 [Bdellovibrionaceae bacterium]|nr:hypothetical protein [Bdellovibrionales bacterium]MCB9255279.1 hypothetical protein [Pseudobdellovibrionaceae bacterium]